MRRIGLILQFEGMGDCLYAIPVIRKLAQIDAGQHAFDLFTYHPALFAHCPYIDRAHSILDEMKINAYAQTNEVKELFTYFGIHHSRIDTTDMISLATARATLSFKEKQLEYFPGESDQAQQFDVVLNSSETWPTRSWKREYWQRLATSLVSRGYSVAVVGKDVQSQADKMLKKSPPLEGCVNLVNKLSLDQTYYTIAKSGLFVSCQNGLSVLAGTTDANIIVLGMSIEWSKRAIYRRQDPHYKVRYVGGSCTRYCCAERECPTPEHKGVLYCQPDYETVEQAALEELELIKSQPV